MPDPSGTARRSRSRLIILTSLAVIGGVALIAVTHREETRQFWRDLRNLSPIAVVTASVLILAQVSLQALRMWAIAPAVAGLRVIRAGYIFAVGDWINIFIPVRGGDASHRGGERSQVHSSRKRV